MKGLILVLLGITTLSSTTYGKHVMLKRQIEEPSLQAVVETLSATVERLQAQVLALQDKLDTQGSGGQQRESVAFMAQYAADTALGVSQGPYVFDNVLLNNGDAYDPSTGTFTAPVSGVYLFAVQLFTNGGDKEHPFVDIKVNGNTLARLAFEEGDGQEDSDSTTVNTQLQAGDKVWIASEEGEEYHLWGGYHTFFTGTLLSVGEPQMPATTIPTF